MQHVGHGIFTWDVKERRTQRYGNIHLCSTSYDGTAKAVATLRMDTLSALRGQWVRLVCHVVQTRESGHLGDRHLGVTPSTPAMGERVEVGVGALVLGLVDAFDGATSSVGLAPGDERGHFWLDPRVLYRLHDQTVDLYVEKTGDPAHPPPPFAPTGLGVISNGDGSMQVVTDHNEPLQVYPKARRVGPGVFTLSFDYEAGETVPCSIASRRESDEHSR